MKTFKQFMTEGRGNSLTGKSHSIIDGLNRGKHAEMNKQSSIHAKVIHQRDLKPLSSDEAAEHDKVASAAREKGDFFSGSTFGDGKNRYSVAQAIEHSKSVKTKKVPTKGFVKQQVRDYWQGNVERAKKAVPGKDNPILIMKHD